MRLSHRVASAEHAIIVHSDGHWRVRDLGSRNGTWIDEQRLGDAGPVPLHAGARLRFGGLAEEWIFVDDAPPGPAALTEAGAVIVASHGMLGLPDLEAPQAIVLLNDRDGWQLERDAAIEQATDGQELALGSTSYRLLLPRSAVRGSLPSTLDTVAVGPDEVRIRLDVSRDGEHVEMTAILPDRKVELGARAHHFVLLALARARAQDARAGGPGSEQGWLYVDELCRMLRIDLSQLNLYLFRARKQLAEEGIPGALGAFERRRLSRQIRLLGYQLEFGSEVTA